MKWNVRFHRLVVDKDLPSLSETIRARVLNAIDKKLLIAPEHYGKPLRGDLFGFWKLRVEDHRVIYSLHKGELLILIVKVGPRKNNIVYRDMMKRAMEVRDNPDFINS